MVFRDILDHPEPYWDYSRQAERQLYATLATACRVNKTWYRLASPLLYNTVILWDLGHPNHPADPAFQDDHHERHYFPEHSYTKALNPRSNLRLLLRTCLEAPHIALQIKTLRSERWECYDNGEHTFPYDDRLPSTNDYREAMTCEQDPVVLALSAAVLDFLPLSEDTSEDLREELKRGNEEAELALLIALVHTSLRTLHLGVDLDCSPQLYCVLSDLEDSAAENETAPPLARLENLAIHGQPSERRRWRWELHIAELQYLTRWPSLRTVICFDIVCVSPPESEDLVGYIKDRTDPSWQRRFELEVQPHIRTFHTHAAPTTHDGLLEIFRAFPNLVGLRIEDCPWERPSRWMESEREALSKALLHHGRRLEKLTWHSLASDDDGDPALPHDFSSFPNFTHLAISRAALLGNAHPGDLPTVLPPRLRHLHILDVKADTYPNYYAHHAADDPGDDDFWAITLPNAVLALLTSPLHADLRLVALELSGSFVRLKEFPEHILGVEDVICRSPRDIVPPERVAAVGWEGDFDEETGTILLRKT